MQLVSCLVVIFDAEVNKGICINRQITFVSSGGVNQAVQRTRSIVQSVIVERGYYLEAAVWSVLDDGFRSAQLFPHFVSAT